jgi:L-lactate dehydrogenase complex protein LldG
MSTPRSRILARLREGHLTARCAAPDIPVREFDWGPDERLVRFREQLGAVRGEVHLVGDDWPARLLDLLAVRGAASLLYGTGTEAGAALEAASASGADADSAVRLVPYRERLESFRQTLFDQIDAGFTTCRGAVAETGTLVLWPDSREPRLLSLVPPIHVALLAADAIRSTFAELMREQCWNQGMPTNALLITGPSKSADIEQTLAYGVHGPKELIVLVKVASQV